jgi:hypothetical protein
MPAAASGGTVRRQRWNRASRRFDNQTGGSTGMTIGETAASALAHARASNVRALAARIADAAIHPLRPFDLWKSRLAAPTLIPLHANEAERAVAELRGLISWVDDGECFSRGVFGAARMNELLGGRITGPRDAVHAAVAVVPTSRRATGWTFHAATAYRAAEDGGIRIVDPLLGRRLGVDGGVFTLDAWAGAVGRRASDVRIQHALDNIPTGSGPITIPATGPHLRGMGRRLAAAIRRADGAAA